MQDSRSCDFFRDKLGTFVYTKPKEFILDDNYFQNAETWVNLIDEVCVLLKKKNPELFEEFLINELDREKRIAYLSKDKQNIHFKKYLPKSKLWLNQKIDAPRSVKMLRLMFKKFQITEDNFCLYINRTIQGIAENNS